MDLAPWVALTAIGVGGWIWTWYEEAQELRQERLQAASLEAQRWQDRHDEHRRQIMALLRWEPIPMNFQDVTPEGREDDQ